LTFYDASLAACAGAVGARLVSADRELLGAGLATSATAIVDALAL